MSNDTLFRPPITGEPRVDRAFQDLARQLNRIVSGVSGGSIAIRSVSGAGGGGIGLRPLAGVAVEVFTYYPADPGNPPEGNLLGSTVTDDKGMWVLELTALGVTQPTGVTVKVAGVVKGINPVFVTGPFYLIDGAYIPLNIGDIELTT